MELNINGDTVSESPTNELINKSIRSLTGEGDSFAILQKTPQVYLQTSGGPSYGFILEYRDGSEDQHYSCSNFELTADEVVWAFQSFLANDNKWKTDLEWQPQVFDYSQSSTGPNLGLIGIGVAVAAFLIWKFVFAT